MSIEAAIAELTAAVKENTSALQAFMADAETKSTADTTKSEGKADKAKDKVVEKAKEPEKVKPKHTVEELRVKARAYSAVEGKEAALAKIKDIAGVEAISDVPEDKIDALVAAFDGSE
jgi:hypothetical protein